MASSESAPRDSAAAATNCGAGPCATAAERARCAGCTCCASPCRCGWTWQQYQERSPARAVATGGLQCPPQPAVPCGGAAALAHGGVAEAWRMPANARAAAYAGAAPVVPPSGSFAFDAKGAFQPYGRPCRLGPLDVLCPPGMHSCKVGEPNLWTCVPNAVPCSVAVNAHYHGYYVSDVYDTTRPNLWRKPRCRRNTWTRFPPPPPPCGVQQSAPCAAQATNETLACAQHDRGDGGGHPACSTCGHVCAAAYY